jgi:NADPH:quinone reductase-like Zn-dependent oxidoreductase
MSFEEACVLPLCLSTAACGLFQKDYLALQHPSVPPKPTGQSLLVWGGSTSVGSNAVQLAVAAGYEVITTSSPKNFKYVQSLGATEVFDYNSPTITSDLINAFKTSGKKVAGAFNVTGIGGTGAFEVCCEVLLKMNGSKFVATAMRASPGMVVPEGIESKMIFGSDLKNNEVSEAVYENFLEEALESGDYKAAPEALVVGRGLEKIQEALEVQKKGVSAKKVVVSLE